MALPEQPPRTTSVSTMKGSTGWPVYALQKGLNAARLAINGGWKILEPDGAFGANTESSVRTFQSAFALYPDGIAGPRTQYRIIELLDQRIHVTVKGVPNGLMKGFAEGEGGNYLAPVNWGSPGGVDCGAVQYRVIGPPYIMDKLEFAFDPYASMKQLATDTAKRIEKYASYDYVKTRGDHVEYSKRLATLEHNWPYAADRLAKGQKLPDQPANWIPSGTKFPDGEPVNTYTEWAEFYAMGSKAHKWGGYIPKYVTDWA